MFSHFRQRKLGTFGVESSVRFKVSDCETSKNLMLSFEIRSRRNNTSSLEVTRSYRSEEVLSWSLHERFGHLLKERINLESLAGMVGMS